MTIPLFGRLVDERFLDRRRRSTSIGGLAGAVVAFGLFEWRYFADHVWSWDLFAVLAAIALVKMGVMGWYLYTDRR